jgi:hypothetical protein
MSNPWVKHIRNFAEKHKMSYACALTSPECRSSYTKMSEDERKKSKEELKKKKEREIEETVRDICATIANKVRNEDESKFPYVRLRFNKTSDRVKQYFIKHYAREYKKLFPNR